MEAFCYKTEIEIIVFDCLVYPGPKFLISKIKKGPNFFSEVRDCFLYFFCFFDPMLSRKAFATNSLN